jgi:hypothetical protein
VTVDSSGDVFVVDSNNHRVQKFAPDGRFITKWGSFGSSDGLFSTPEGVAAHPSDDYLYVVDLGNHRIQRFERFGFSLGVTPASRNVVQGKAANYTLTLTGVGPNTQDTPVSFCLLSGLPNATTDTFTPSSADPNDNAPVEATLTLDTAPATRAKTYTLFIEAQGGGQTRLRQVTLKVTN